MVGKLCYAGGCRKFQPIGFIPYLHWAVRSGDKNVPGKRLIIDCGVCYLQSVWYSGRGKVLEKKRNEAGHECSELGLLGDLVHGKTILFVANLTCSCPLDRGSPSVQWHLVSFPSFSRPPAFSSSWMGSLWVTVEPFFTALLTSVSH